MLPRSARFGTFSVVFILSLPLPGVAQESEVADFSGLWQRSEDADGRTFHPPAAGPGPILEIREQNGIRLGDVSNPILRPDAAAAVEAFNARGRTGEVVLPAWSLCWPSGVPLVLNMGEPIQFVQSRDQVTILYRRDMQVRRIYLNGAQPISHDPSWYGYSVGHYEGPNTLVVDTRHQNASALVDRFGTPRSEVIHVVERYTMMPDRSAIQVEFVVEDPETFTTPWKATLTYWPAQEPFVERICAENNKNPDGGLYPVPRDDNPDDDF
jgi:hypothetical protein